MKYLFSLLVLAVLATTVVYSAGNVKTFGSTGKAYDIQSATYADSYVDTLKYWREAGVSALTFSIYYADSASITNIIVYRKFQGQSCAILSADTLVSTLAATAAGAKNYTITMNPLPEAYYFVVTYADSANGVTTPTVKYGLHRTYSK